MLFELATTPKNNFPFHSSYVCLIRDSCVVDSVDAVWHDSVEAVFVTSVMVFPF